jgi:hypothetical protein
LCLASIKITFPPPPLVLSNVERCPTTTRNVVNLQITLSPMPMLKWKKFKFMTSAVFDLTKPVRTSC